MKILIYSAAPLVFIVLFAVLLVTGDAGSMSMPIKICSSAILVAYAVLMSLVGEGKSADERESHHRYLANRYALVVGTLVLSAGLIWQLFQHVLDLWLLAGLVAINLAKALTLIYAHYKR